MKKSWNVPIIGAQTESSKPLFASSAFWSKSIEQMLTNNLQFESIRKVGELRKSCGVESPKTTITVRSPRRK